MCFSRYRYDRRIKALILSYLTLNETPGGVFIFHYNNTFLLVTLPDLSHVIFHYLTHTASYPSNLYMPAIR